MAGMLRLPDATDAAADAEVQAALVAATLQMLRAGVVVTPEFYAGLVPLERAALVVAHEAVEVERAARLGLAMLGPLGLAEVTAPLDGGAAKEALLKGMREARTRAMLEAAAGSAGQARPWARGTGMRPPPRLGGAPPTTGGAA